jgi:hypothetical protein
MRKHYKLTCISSNDHTSCFSIPFSGGLSGPFPMGIVHLSFLQTIRFGASLLTGPLPTGITALEHLREIDLQMNRFTGEVPTEWWQSRLVSMNLGHNQLSGSMPPELKNLQNVKELRLGVTNLPEPFPKRSEHSRIWSIYKSLTTC